MGRKVLERQHITGGQIDDGFGSGGSGEFRIGAKHREQILSGAVVGDNQNQRPACVFLPQQREQRLRGRSESRDTNTPRAVFQMGGNAKESRKLFHIRKKFADERQSLCS